MLGAHKKSPARRRRAPIERSFPPDVGTEQTCEHASQSSGPAANGYCFSVRPTYRSNTCTLSRLNPKEGHKTDGTTLNLPRFRGKSLHRTSHVSIWARRRNATNGSLKNLVFKERKRFSTGVGTHRTGKRDQPTSTERFHRQTNRKHWAAVPPSIGTLGLTQARRPQSRFGTRKSHRILPFQFSCDLQRPLSQLYRKGTHDVGSGCVATTPTECIRRIPTSFLSSIRRIKVNVKTESSKIPSNLN